MNDPIICQKPHLYIGIRALGCDFSLSYRQYIGINIKKSQHFVISLFYIRVFDI